LAGELGASRRPEECILDPLCLRLLHAVQRAPHTMLDARPTPSSEDPTQPVLDAGALDQLRQLDPTGGSSFVVRVLGTYERSLERHIAEARQAQAASQWEALGRTAHTLKSASASVGALAFSALCAEVESLVRQHDTAGLQATLARFFSEAGRVRDAVLAQMPAGSGQGPSAS
jgi:HPt (histidine-containing phosphotransfer) domain-containing protein